MAMSKKQKTIAVVLAVFITMAAAALASYFTDTSSDWYRSLVLPAFQPPPVVFSIVWPVLYGLFALSFALYAITPNRSDHVLLLYIFNLALNPLWTYVFFTAHHPVGAVFLLAGMILSALYLYKKVYEKNTTAAYLLLPYIVWLSFAFYLNYETAFLN
jgi:tryptophan-rich sensory protein